MDFLNGKIKTLYFKYLAAAYGSASITSIYSIVDMAMVGSTMARKELGADSIWFAMPLTELIVAVYVGCMIMRYTKQLSTERKCMNKIITIGREFGSGGREVGKRLAGQLGYTYYAQEIVSEISQRTSLSEQYVHAVI